MHSRVRSVLLIVLFVAWAHATSAQSVGNVRGRVVRHGPAGDYPVAGIAVRVNSPGRGYSRTVYSGQDGMYYLYNIPTGACSLYVTAVPERPPLVFTIQVTNQPWTDIAAVHI